MIREALRALLEAVMPCEVFEAASGLEACSVIGARRLDLVLLDVRMPGMDGIEALRRIKTIAPMLPVLMLSTYDADEDVRHSLDEGARGYIVKGATSHQLRQAVDTALSGDGIYVHPVVAEHMLQAGRRGGGEGLSERERAVLARLRAGATNDQIAATLSLSRKTVKSHLSAIFRKLGVANRTEAVAKALNEGILPRD